MVFAEAGGGGPCAMPCAAARETVSKATIRISPLRTNTGSTRTRQKSAFCVLSRSTTSFLLIGSQLYTERFTGVVFALLKSIAHRTDRSEHHLAVLA